MIDPGASPPGGWHTALNKLGRLRRAFARGFWYAWLEVPPAYARSRSEITIVVDCDTTQFDRKMRDVLHTITKAEHWIPRFQ